MPPGLLSETLPLAPLECISPSRFHSLRECALREVWAAAGVPNQLPTAPAARLGSAIHRLLAEAGKGLFREGGRAAVELRWDKLIGETESVMKASWLEGHLLPLKTAVPDFEVRRLRALQRGQEINESLPAAPGPSGAHGPRGTEVWVATPDGVAGGYIDQVGTSAAGLVLRDYKSGQIVEEAAAGGAGVLKVAYEVQLKLYAAVYASATGTWPGRLELVPLYGPAREVPFSRHECLEILRQARETLRAINTCIADHSPVDAMSMLAAPSPAKCRHCPYRPSCGAYKQLREQGSADESWPEDLWGTVCAKQVLGNGKVLLTIQPSTPGAPVVTVRGLSSAPDRHPALPHLQAGKAAAFFGLKRGGQRETLQESFWTVIYRFDEKTT